ncbi:MAG: hypothetical protein DRZ76_04125 [Candidatus Nealsonbacteria bacterium]|nr:MAG: hypothetical protein DRZ76_04125 [Candidatus Nealsonbacteria bacterium]
MNVPCVRWTNPTLFIDKMNGICIGKKTYYFSGLSVLQMEDFLKGLYHIRVVFFRIITNDRIIQAPFSSEVLGSQNYVRDSLPYSFAKRITI